MKIKSSELNALLEWAYNCGLKHSEFVPLGEDDIKYKLTDKGKDMLAMMQNIEDMPTTEYQPPIQEDVRAIANEMYQNKKVEWFLNEENIQKCFYNLSKQEVEDFGHILGPHIIETHNDIFEHAVPLDKLAKELNDIDYIRVNKTKYRSLPIMLYKCFGFTTWENDNHTMYRIFYRELDNKTKSQLRESGYHLSEAIQDYIIQ